MTVQARVGTVTGKISFSGCAVTGAVVGRGGGGPYWGAALAAAARSSREIIARLEEVGQSGG